ncbi:LexA family protein [Acinetobacter towneri]|uniref:LexA family protein n=1 Tax=Acinetobacter towneri TaxID=202956 RepID=UPI003A8AA57C
MSTLQERMSLAIKHYEKTTGNRFKNAELARYADVTRANVGLWVNGPTKELEGSKLHKAAEFLRVNSKWLAGQNAPMELTSLDNNIAPVTARLLPVISWVQAGTMTSVEAINPSEINEWLPPLSLDDPARCFYLRVVGVSNSPTYVEGDYILVNPSFQTSDLVSGDLVVVRHNSDATFKKFVVESDERKYLQALNPNFHPNIIEFEDGMELIGLVIDAFRPLGGSRPKRVRKS